MHYYTAAYGANDISDIENDIDRNKAILIKDVIADLKELSKKLKELSIEARSVSSHKDDGNKCDHKYTTRIDGPAKCSKCGHLLELD